LVLSVCALALVSCGGRTSANDELEAFAADNGGASGAGAGTGGAAGNACGDPEPLPPCAGSSNLEPYARVHAACSTDTTVNRRGTPVPICHHIK
jgi:hypothetical protein